MSKISDLSARLLASRMHAGAERSFDVSAISDTIHRALSAAGLDPRGGSPNGITDTIQRALSAAGLNAGNAQWKANSTDALARARDVTHDAAHDAAIASTASAEETRPGNFVSRSFTNHAGTRTYKLYVPARYASEGREPMPMVVMMHGCTQSPDDFAAGTRMNELAEEHGFLVVYPAQAANANGSRCWNWFRSEDQSRDRGEPALIAGMVRHVASSHRVDERRIFVAGLSAGAAMAVILGATYPEIFAAVGAHSGLPYGAACDMPSAFGAMQGAQPLAGLPKSGGADAVSRAQGTMTVPTIVFHGDSDRTVHARNGAAIVEQVTAGRSEEQPLRASVHEGAAGGRTYRRTVYADAADQPIVEDWVLYGAGHAWSGGSPSGSFTDTAGPDASAEMIRFFYAQRRAGTA